MPPVMWGFSLDSAKKVSTRHSTPTPEMPQAVAMAAPLAPPAAWSPDMVNTPAPTMRVMTVVDRRNSPMPWGFSLPNNCAPTGTGGLSMAGGAEALAVGLELGDAVFLKLRFLLKVPIS